MSNIVDNSKHGDALKNLQTQIDELKYKTDNLHQEDEAIRTDMQTDTEKIHKDLSD